MNTADLFVKINALPADLQKEVGDLVEKLLKKLQKSSKKNERPLGMFKGKRVARRTLCLGLRHVLG